MLLRALAGAAIILAVWATGWSVAGAQQELPVVLTPEEQAWLAEQHTVRVRVTDNAPSTFIVDGKAVGIAPEFIEAISKRTGIKFRFIIPSPSFSEDLDGLIQHTGPDVIPSLQRTSERATNVLFTQAYMSSPRFIFARDDAPFIGALEELSGRSVAVVEDYLVQEWLSQDYPNIDVQLHPDNQSALRAVSSGKAFAFIGPLRTTSYMINRLGLSNLKAFSQTSLPVTDSQTSLPVAETSMGVRSDWPELRSIIDKGLDAIPASEKAAIVNRWSAVKLEHRVQLADVLKWVLVVVGVGVAVVLMFAVWNRSLRRRVLERTEQLSESEQRFRATFEQAAVGIAHVSASGQLVRVNQKFCDIVGYPQEEILKKTFQQITHADDLDADMHNMRRLLAGEAESYGMEKRYVHKSGDLVWVYLRVSLVRDKARQKEWFVSVIEDITERKNAEEALRSSKSSLAASEEKFRQLVQQSPLSIQIVKPDGRIEEVNQAFREMWGIPENDLPEVLEKYNMLEDEEARRRGVLPLIKRAFGGEAVVLPEIKYEAETTMDAIGVDTESNSVWVRARLYPVKNQKGEVVRVVDIEEDITAQKRASDKLQAYQKRLRALATDLTLAEERERREIATELHDGAAQSLALARIQLASASKAVAGTEPAEKLDEASQLVRESLRQIRQILLDLSSPALAEIGLAAALSEWLEVQIGRGHGLRTSFDDRAGNVPLNDDILAVLFRNARELMMNTVKHAKAGKVAVCLEVSEGALRITVEDDGVGFDPEAAASRPGGEASFGLFSVHERMADMGGSLEIVSAPGEGCRATLIAPLSDGQDRSAA